MPPTDVMFTRHVAGRMDDRQPNSVCRYRGLTVVSTRPTPLIPYIPSSRPDQHGAHDAALRPFVLGFACGRSALTATPHTRLPKTGRNHQENGLNPPPSAT
jgi:hypothetical protein